MLALWKKFQQFYGRQFAPKIYEVLKTGYDTEKFRRDCISGITVAVISIPLAMALAIASGVTPAQGLYTAIVAGFFIALLGGSRYQIGGRPALLSSSSSTLCKTTATTAWPPPC